MTSLRSTSKVDVQDKELICGIDSEENNGKSSSTVYSFKLQNSEIPNAGFYFPRRYVFVVLSFFGMVMLYALRVNLSVAIVSMVHTPPIGLANDTLLNATQTNPSHTSEFDWDERVQGIVLASFFWGYVITQLPGGRMADKFGTKWILFFGVLFASLFTIVSPLAARKTYELFVACRFFEGLFEGFTFPAMHSMLAKWLPPSERSGMAAIIYSGSLVGTVLTLPVSALLCGLDDGNGWPYVFYCFGMLGIIWSLFWWSMIYENPEDHPRMKQSEMNHIHTGLSVLACESKPPIPWRKVLTSIPLWALVVTHFGQNWGFYTLLTQMPRFLSQVLGFNLRENGLYSSLPYLLQALVGASTGLLSDRLIRNGKVKLGFMRKLSNTIGFVGPAVCLYLITLIGRSQLWCIVLLICSMGLNGFILAGFNVTHVDMSPNYAGTLMGITNCIANCAGFLAPYTIGVILSGAKNDDDVLLAWHRVFYLSSSIYLVTAIVFIVFASNELQAWNDSRNENTAVAKLEL